MASLPSASLTGLTLPSLRAAEEPRVLACAQDEVLRLFDSCGPGLRGYLRSFGLPPDAVEDVLQEVFLALFRHLERGRPRTHLRGWLFRVGQHLALRQRARLARERRREGTLDLGIINEVKDPARDVEHRLIAQARMRRLSAVILALPERDRRCLGLRAAGLQYREIARTLQVSLSTVAASMARAGLRLRNADAGGDHARG